MTAPMTWAKPCAPCERGDHGACVGVGPNADPRLLPPGTPVHAPCSCPCMFRRVEPASAPPSPEEMARTRGIPAGPSAGLYMLGVEDERKRGGGRETELAAEVDQWRRTGEAALAVVDALAAVSKATLSTPPTAEEIDVRLKARDAYENAVRNLSTLRAALTA